jgi:hypothetical protein
MSERYVCLRRQRIGGVLREVGYEFDRQPYHKNLIAWVHSGHIRRLDVMSVAPKSAKQPIPPDLSGLKKAELIDLMDGLGFSLDAVEGTGSGGAVTKPDITRFLESKR